MLYYVYYIMFRQQRCSSHRLCRLSCIRGSLSAGRARGLCDSKYSSNNIQNGVRQENKIKHSVVEAIMFYVNPILSVRSSYMEG